jgi:chloramphenicol 3-O-phosphotransferase
VAKEVVIFKANMIDEVDEMLACSLMNVGVNVPLEAL